MRQAIKARDVKPGDVLEHWGAVNMVEVDDTNVVIGYEGRPDNEGDWGDFDPNETLYKIG